jgi:hypothetical protein
VDEVLYNGYNYTSETFQDFMDLAQYHNLTIADRGQFFSLTSTVNFTILNPHQPLVSTNLNENSIVLQLQVSNVSFLFTGDATMDSEQSMLGAGLGLQSDVLKVGYHGSNTASSQSFLDAVNPSYAVISCGLNNFFGHPHIETIQKLLNKGITIYGTYVSGNIAFSTNGNTMSVLNSPQAIPTPTPTPTPTATPSPTTSPLSTPTPTPTPTPSPTPTSTPTPTATPTPTPTPSPSPTATENPNPTPSIPEFSSFLILPCLVGVTMVGALIFKRKMYNKLL